MKNDHYVTKAYLDRFIHPQSIVAGNQVLFPYAKGGAVCRPRGTKNLGSAEHFYTQKLADGRVDTALDEALQKAELYIFASGKRNPGMLAKCIFSDQLPQNPVERDELIVGIALMRCRTPVQIHNTSVMNDLCDHAEVFNQLNKPEARDACRKSPISDAEIEYAIDRVRQKFLNGELRVGVEDQKQDGLESLKYVQTIFPVLKTMRLRLVKSFHSDVFIASDNPVVINVPEDSRGQGLQQSKATEVWFPISHNRGLLLIIARGQTALTKRAIQGRSS